MDARVKAGMVITIVFVVGFLAGVGGSVCFLAMHGGIPGWESDTPAFFMRGPGARMERMARVLELTPQQREQIEPILSETREQFRAMRSRHRPERHLAWSWTTSRPG